MISENSLELLEYPKLLRILSEQAHCPATRQAVLDIRPFENLDPIIQRQRLVEEIRNLKAEGNPLAPLSLFRFETLPGKGPAGRGGLGTL